MDEKRLIDANTMREDWLENGENEFVYDTNAVLDSIDAQPTVDAVEVVHGHWIDRYGGRYANQLYECSECKEKALYKIEVDELCKKYFTQALSKYCPSCNAIMDSDGNG